MDAVMKYLSRPLFVGMMNEWYFGKVIFRLYEKWRHQLWKSGVIRRLRAGWTGKYIRYEQTSP